MLQLPHLTLSDLGDLAEIVFGLLGIIVGAGAVLLARAQLIPLRQSIEQLAESERQRVRLTDVRRKVIPRKNRSLVGFDPRLGNQEWHQLCRLKDKNPKSVILDLSEDYAAFSKRLMGDLHFIRESIIVVDLALVPEYMHRKVIAPLGKNLGQTPLDLVQERAGTYGRTIDERVLRIIELMCSDENGTKMGALPLWINCHGRLFSEEISLDERRSLERYHSLNALYEAHDAEELLECAGVQTDFISSAAFEFWGHLSYRDCRPFRTKGSIVSLTLRSELQYLAFCKAISDLAVRLRYSALTTDIFKSATNIDDLLRPGVFGLHHRADGRLVRLGAVKWKPIFSSELLPIALRPTEGKIGSVLEDDRSFRPAYVRRASSGSWSYLSSIGGYGLALPYGAEHDPESVKALKYFFLSNPYSFHPYLSDMLVQAAFAPGENFVDEFLYRHARPRWPFWSRAEPIFTECLFRVLLLVNQLTSDAPAGYWIECMRELSAQSVMREVWDAFSVLEAKLGVVAESVGWSVVVSPTHVFRHPQ